MLISAKNNKPKHWNTMKKKKTLRLGNKINKGKVIKVSMLVFAATLFFFMSQRIQKNKKEKSIEDDILAQIEKKDAKKQKEQTQKGKKNLYGTYMKDKNQKEQDSLFRLNETKGLQKERARISFTDYKKGSGHERDNELDKTPPLTTTKSPKGGAYYGRFSNGVVSFSEKPKPQQKSGSEPNSVIIPSQPIFGSSSQGFVSSGNNNTGQVKTNAKTNFTAIIDGHQTVQSGSRVRLIIKSGIFNGSPIHPNSIAFGIITYNQSRAIITLNQVSTQDGVKYGRTQNMGMDGRPGLFIADRRGNTTSTLKNEATKRGTGKLQGVVNNVSGGLAREVIGVAGTLLQGHSQGERQVIKLFNRQKLRFR